VRDSEVSIILAAFPVSEEFCVPLDILVSGSPYS
jgi:hypothetical protein